MLLHQIKVESCNTALEDTVLLLEICMVSAHTHTKNHLSNGTTVIPKQ